MAKRNYEKSNEKFTQALVKAVVAAGAVKVDSFYEYELATKAGVLRLSVRPNGAQYGASVFARFDDVEKAKALGLLHLNPYSGKWNHHYFPNDVKPESIAYAVGNITHCLASVRA